MHPNSPSLPLMPREEQAKGNGSALLQQPHCQGQSEDATSSLPMHMANI